MIDYQFVVFASTALTISIKLSFREASPTRNPSNFNYSNP
jgi:hypothetical protein